MILLPEPPSGHTFSCHEVGNYQSSYEIACLYEIPMSKSGNYQSPYDIACLYEIRMSKSRNYQSPYDIACMYEFPMSKSCMCLLMHKPMPCDVMNSIAF